MRPILIEEIGIEKPKRLEAPLNQSESSKKIKDEDSKKFDTFLSTSKSGTAQPTISEVKMSMVDQNSNHQNKITELSQPNAKQDCSISFQNSKCVQQTAEKLEDSFTSSNEPLNNKTTVLRNDEAEVSEMNREFAIPLTSFQFQADYKLLKNKPAEFFKYFIVSIYTSVYFHNAKKL